MSWTKVEKEKTESTKVDRTEKGWLSGPWFFDWFTGAFKGIWIKVNKEKGDFSKVNKEILDFTKVNKTKEDWNKVTKE